VCLPWGLPNKIVYAIGAASARRDLGCRVNDNTPLQRNPKALPIPGGHFIERYAQKVFLDLPSHAA